MTGNEGEIATTEAVNLLDVRTWAIATLTQIRRARSGWIETLRAEAVDAPVRPEDPNEILNLDVHFLLIAAHQLVDARRRKLEARLPRLSPRLVRAIEQLRPIREHYVQHRPSFTDEGAPLTGRAKALRALDPDAHAWGLSGNVVPNPGGEMVVAGVLPLDELEEEVLAIFDAANVAIQRVVEDHERQ